MKKITILATLLLLVGISIDGAQLPAKNRTQVFHVLLFNWKPNTDKERIKEMDGYWTSLQKNIEGFESYEMNALESGYYEHVVILVFNSNQAYEAYNNNSEHKLIQKLGSDIVSDFLSYSYRK